MKLTAEIIPKPCWYRNLRKLAPKQWPALRDETKRKAGYRCEICGGGGSLHCHEVFDYNDGACVQMLVGLQAICEDCHDVKHFGQMAAALKDDDLALRTRIRELTSHFCRVNGVNNNDFMEYVKQQKELWARRSQFTWTTALTEYVPIVVIKNGDVIKDATGWS